MAAERLVRPTLALLVALLLAGPLAGLPGVGASPAAAAEPAPLQVLFVLDVSGSMARSVDGSAQSLLDGARDALARVSKTLPPEVALGLRVYGATYGGTDKGRSCADTQLVVPPAADSAGAIIDASRKLTPVGDTPIGRSLLAAARDFSPGAKKIVVLISDGEDTCHPPAPAPCRAAGTVHGRDAELRVDTIGLALAGQQRAVRALRCVARATGGSYYGADNAQGLAAALAQIAKSTILRLGPGRNVTGAERPEGAPKVAAGAYRTKLKPGETRWFRVDAGEGQLPEVLATIQGRRGLSVPYYGRSCESWQIQLFNPYGEGGSYPPYGNQNVFDGTGFAGVGAKGSKPISATADGIDFPGAWTFALSLAATDDTVHPTMKCADYLPLDDDFDVRFTLDLDPAAQPEASLTTPSPTGTPSMTPSITPSATPSVDAASASPSASVTDGGFLPGDLPPTTKYDDQAASAGVDWTLPVVAVLLAALAALGVVVIRRWRRSRYL